MILLLKNSENESDFSKIMISNKTHYLHNICFSILINTVILKNMYSCTVYDKNNSIVDIVYKIVEQRDHVLLIMKSDKNLQKGKKKKLV